MPVELSENGEFITEYLFKNVTAIYISCLSPPTQRNYKVQFMLPTFFVI